LGHENRKQIIWKCGTVQISESGENSHNVCYHSTQNLLSSRLLLKSVKMRIYITIILPVVLYGLKLGLTLKKEHRLRVFENGANENIWGKAG
jgi:hypothetical protein